MQVKLNYVGLKRGTLPLVAALLIVLVTICIERALGRPWWCACGEPTMLGLGVNSQHNSQHLFDAYSLSHINHGLIFFLLLSWCLKGVTPAWRAAVAVSIEAGWELLENTPLIIDRYRAVTVSLGYYGDSVANSMGDLISCMIGFAIAATFGFRVSLLLFFFFEVVLLITIRDSLALNVLMLIYPLSIVRGWQAGA